MQILTKKVEDLTKTEYRACYAANYGWNGYMREELVASRDNPTERPGTAILIWDGPDDKTTSLKAWCLMTPVRTWGLVGGTRYTKRVSKYSVQFWVKRQYRKQGLATRLMNEVKKYDPKPHVFPHCKASGEFFSGYNVTILDYDKHWMRKKPKAG